MHEAAERGVRRQQEIEGRVLGLSFPRCSTACGDNSQPTEEERRTTEHGRREGWWVRGARAQREWTLATRPLSSPTPCTPLVLPLKSLAGVSQGTSAQSRPRGQ